MKVYEISAGPYVLYARVQHIDDEDTRIQFVNSEYQDCLTIQIWKGCPMGEIYGIIYDRLCASNIPLEKLTDTVIILKAALKFAMKKFKHLQSFDVTDNSQVDCGNRKVSLSDMNFLVLQNTWYEELFGAVSKYAHYRADVERMKQPPNVDFEVLWERYLKHGRMYFAKSKEEYAEMYRQSPSWAAFFNRWFQEEGCRPFLYLADYDKGVMRWLQLSTRAYHGKEWMITRDMVGTYDVDIRARKVDGRSVPDIKWSYVHRERIVRGGQMLLPLEVMYE